MEIQTNAIELNLSDKGQMFAGVATIRAAIADALDAGPMAIEDWHFYGDDDLYTEDDALRHRGLFMDAVIKRIAELQTAPHDGIKLENLCPRHRRESLPEPTAQVCGMCQAERGVRGSASMAGGS